MRRTALVLLVVAAAAFAQSQKERLRRALVRIQVTDNGYHKAVELKEKGAPISQLRRIRIHQAFELVLSGVVISPQGEIVTTALHPEADLRVMVTMHDGASHPAFVIGTDPQSNLALIRVPVGTKDHLELKEGPVAARQEVDLLGHELARPVGVRGTVAQMALSVCVRDLYRINAGRDIPIGQVFLVAGPVARPNPGSACVDEAGNCIGLTIGTMPPLVTTRGAYEVTSVVPAARVARVVRDLRLHGRVVRAFYGFYIVPASGAIRSHFELPGSASSVVQLEPDSPATKAGMHRNDILLSVDGESFDDMSALGEALTGRPPHKPVRLKVLRAGKQVELTCTPRER